MDEPRRKWSTSQKLLLQVVLLPVLLPLGVELALRVADGHDSAAAEQRILDQGALMRTGVVDQGGEEQGADNALEDVHFLHPYYGYDSYGGVRDYDEGAAWFRSPEADETLDVVIVGGSVSARFGNHGTKRLAKLLRADARFADREVRFWSYGRGGFKQPQQLTLFDFLLVLGYEPDVLINIDGFNEVALGNFNAENGAHPLYPSMAHWGRIISNESPEAANRLLDLRSHMLRAEDEARELVDRGCHKSAILTRWALSRLARINARGGEAYDAFLEVVATSDEGRDFMGPTFEAGIDKVLATVIEGWQAASRTLQATCDARGIRYVHVLQPTLHDPGSKPLTPEEIETGSARQSWIDGSTRGYPLLRAGGSELLAEGVEFLDLSMLFEQHVGKLYIDACHFTREGSELMADRIAAVLLAAE